MGIVGHVAGIQPNHASRLRIQLAALETAQMIGDMDIPGFRLHPLKGAERGRAATGRQPRRGGVYTEPRAQGNEWRQPGDGAPPVQGPRPFAGELAGHAGQL